MSSTINWTYAEEVLEDGSTKEQWIGTYLLEDIELRMIVFRNAPELTWSSSVYLAENESFQISSSKENYESADAAKEDIERALNAEVEVRFVQ